MIAAGGDGTLVRAEADNGRQLWRVKAGTDLTTGPASDGNIIAVGGAKGMLLAFDMDGKPLWQAQLSSELLSAPAVARRRGGGAQHRQPHRRLRRQDRRQRSGPCSAPCRR